MGDEPLISGSDLPEVKHTFTESFENAFPFFLSIGMTYDQFWRDDVMLCKAYLKAYRIKNRQRNQEMWIQGMYNFAAFSTTLANAFRGKGESAQDYLKEPLALDKQEARERAEKARRLEEERFKAIFTARAAIINQQLASADNSEENKNV